MMLLFCLATLFYFMLHSFFAGNRVKSRFMAVTAISSRGYRVFYNLLSLITLLFLFYLWKNAGTVYWFRPVTFAGVAGITVSLTGLLIMLICFKNYDVASFLGLYKEIKMPLNQKGLNRFVRHPLYFGTLLFILGLSVAQPYIKNWLFLLLLTAYLIVGSRLEENKLIIEFGDEYVYYQKKTKRLIPFIY